MDLQAVLSTLGLGTSLEVLAEHWAESESCFPARPPRFLVPGVISATREFARLPSGADPTLHEAARRILASEALRHLAWHCSRLAHEHLDYSPTSMRQWPLLTEALGELDGAFYLLIGLDAVTRMRSVHGLLGIPEAVSRDSCCDYLEALTIHREHHSGRFGVLPQTLYWHRNLVRGELYRLGRLEYMLRPFPDRVVAYRHRTTRAVVALSVDGACFDADGYVSSVEAPDAWPAALTEAADQVEGVPIAPRGHALRRRVSLMLSDWERTLSPGDTVLEVHIPAGGRMTPDRCRASMQQALEFFPHYFPDRTFTGFACQSWILNPELDRIYRPDSNMVTWQRELYLFPVGGGPRAGVYFVFGDQDVDPALARRNTSLRRALAEHMASGGRLIAGGMFMLSEDSARFGAQPYRCRWPETLSGLPLVSGSGTGVPA